MGESPPGGFAGCHGVRVEPAGRGAAYGTTAAAPEACLSLEDDALGPGMPPGAVLLWSAEVDDGPAGLHTHEMWRLPDGALVLGIGGRLVLRVGADRTSAAVGAVSDAVALQLVSTFALTLAAQAWGAFVVHAAVATRGDATVAVCGESGAGKSSVLSALIDAGWSAVSEDLVALDVRGPGSPLAWPGPPWLRIAPGTAGPRGTAERFRTPDKVAWDLDGRRCDRPVRLTHLILLDPATPEPATARTATATEVIAGLARHTPWFEEPSRRGAELFAPAVLVARSVVATRVRLQRSPVWTPAAVATVERLTTT